MKELAEYVFKKEGYYRLSSNLTEFNIFFRPENNLMNIIHLIDYSTGFSLLEEEYELLKEKVRKLFQERGVKNIHMLSIIISRDVKKAEILCEKDRFCWIMEPESEKLLIYENQVEDFYGLRKKLEECFLHKEEIKAAAEKERQAEVAYIEKENTEKKKTNSLKQWKQYPYINIGIVCVNILIFLLCTFLGELLYNIGVLYGPLILEKGEYYRFFTAIFLHGDVNHLTSNMIMLFFLGEIVEEEVGHIRYLLLYFLSGLGGGILSVWYEYFTGNFHGSIGASGAVFGIVGVLAFLVIRNRGKLKTITYGKITFLIVYSLYSGFTGSNTDNAAHIGGLISGFFLAAAGYLLFGKKKRHRGKEQI